MSVTVREERITPKLARQILDANNTGNRPVSAARVSQYARDMIAGRWAMTGDTLKFAAGGRLLDGQHRLRAVVEANKPIDFMVARNVKSEVFTHIDTGKSRTGSDVLVIEGMDASLAMTVSTMARMAYGYEKGSPTSGRAGGRSRDRDALDNAAIIDYVGRHPELVTAASFVSENYAKGALLSLAQLGWVYYETRKKNETEAGTFVLDIIHGTMLAREDAVYRLREVLIEERASKRRSSMEAVLAGVVKAWNKRRAGRKIPGPNILLRHDWRDFPRFE